MTEDAPTLREVNAEEWEDTFQRLPHWFRKPLAITKPQRSWHGGPSETVTCSEHPEFRAHGLRFEVLYWARKHVEEAHAGRTPRTPTPDPWSATDPSEEPPF